jgi:oligopeptide transport system ATP-binding protein
MNSALPLLDIENLRVSLPTKTGDVHAVRGVTLHINSGEILAIVGESGCGKSVTAQAIMQLLPASARIDYDRAVTPAMAMIFQNPMATFNPTLSIGYQIAEPLQVHRAFNRSDAETETVRLLSRMGIENAQQRAQQYPHQFSGGMLQRAAIAMALAMQPELLIADEPTTALDVSTQADVMQLLAELRAEKNLALLFISHDLALVSKHADRVAVMYAGEIVETAKTTAVLQNPQHPYTRALIASLPGLQSATRLQTIDGAPPDLHQPPTGCAFCERCSQRLKICVQQSPPLLSQEAHAARCWLLHPLASTSSVTV